MKKAIYILILLPVILGACSRNISSDIVTGLNVKEYNTYAFFKPDEKAETTISDQNLANFVSSELEKRGYRLDTENPDILVKVDLKVENKKALVREPMYSYAPFGFNRWGMNPYFGGWGMGNSYIAGYTHRDVNYTEGTIVIDIFDRKKDQHIWRGWSIDQLDRKSLKAKQLAKEVQKIFKEYPVKPLKN